MMRTVCFFRRAAVVLALAATLHAQQTTQFIFPPQLVQQQVSRGDQEDQFGNSTALNAHWAVIGSYATDGPMGESNVGAADIYKRSGNTWNHHQRIIANDGLAMAKFGWAVAISGNWIVVGAEEAVRNPAMPLVRPGAAYVYEYNATNDRWGVQSGTDWIQTDKLVASNSQHLAWFGRAVRLVGNRLLVAAYARNEGSPGNVEPDIGRVYSFDLVGSLWGKPGNGGRIENASFVGSNPTANMRFGKWMDIAGDSAVIGAHKTEVNTLEEAGRVYVFDRSGTTWTEVHSFEAPTPTEGDHFGKTVAMSPNRSTIVVSVHQADGADPADEDCNSGRVLIYDYTPNAPWTSPNPVVLEPTGLECTDRFGAFFGFSGNSGNRLVVGAIGDDDGGLDAGKAYFFKKIGATWTQQLTLRVNQSGANYGKGVDLHGRRLLVGAQYFDVNGVLDTGAAYFSVVP
jgi:hypothetical protein